MADAAWEVYIKLLLSGGNREMRRQTLHAVIMSDLSEHAWQDKGPGVYRVGHRRWAMFQKRYSRSLSHGQDDRTI